MKKYLYIIISIIFFSTGIVSAQSPSFKEDDSNHSSESEADDPCIIQEKKLYSWRISPELGTRYEVPIDTTFLNYGDTDVEDCFTTAYNYLGNYGSPGESRIFFKRLARPDFMFMDSYQRFNVSPSKATFYNTQIPFTQVSYLTGGSKPNAEDHFMVNFGANVNKKLGFGASLDYTYARGFYEFQGVNSINWQLYGSYISDKYQLQAYTNLASFSNQENGGITDMEYILRPDNVNSVLTDPKNIPTNLINAWNKVRNNDFYLTQRYNLGFERDVYLSEDDSVGITQFVPVTSFVHTFHLNYNFRKFIINSGGIQNDEFFQNTYINDSFTDDTVKYLSVKNTLGIALNEGFHKYAKFGLGAYATLENRVYHNMQDSLDLGYIDRKYNTNIIWVGGQLIKQRGSILTYNVDAKVALTGYNMGDIDITGRLQTKIPLFKDSVMVRANGFFKNTEPSYYMKHYFSNHFKWKNGFDKEQRYRVEGEVFVPFTGTTLSAGVENITKYLYFNDNALASQHSGNVQVFSATLNQNFRFGIFNWDNSVVYQKSSNEKILPLPEISVYSQMYLKFRIAKVLHTQLGTDVHYFTKYYSPVYQPGILTFHTQQDYKVGNYPLMNVYANFKLKDTRFFVMYYHVNQGLFGSNNYFLAPNYPWNPRFFKLGVSIDFGN